MRAANEREQHERIHRGEHEGFTRVTTETASQQNNAVANHRDSDYFE